MVEVINSLFKIHLKRYQSELETFAKYPIVAQKEVLQNILRANFDTQFGNQYHFSSIHDYKTFQKRVPVHTYQQLEPYINKIIEGEERVLTSSKVKWMAKTAGTTSGTSKFIPITKENLQDCHLKGSWYALATLYAHREDLKIFAKRNLLIGGGIYNTFPKSNIQVGDISAIMIRNIPLILRPFYIPDVKTATSPNWEDKVDYIAELAAKEPHISMLGGVPTWNLTLYRKILDLTGADSLLDVWPNLQAYIHGGVRFKPYREHFKNIIPSEDFLYLEVYNASEGFFAVQNDLLKEDLLLILNNGVFFEFIPFDDFNKGNHNAFDLSEVEVGKSYVPVITSNTGLYRYVLGDVLTFTNTYPFKIKITGRTKEYINAFGEDLLVDNAENALVKTCESFKSTVKDYTIAPFYVRLNEKGRHQWFIEFEKAPQNLDQFEVALDKALQVENNQYTQKRSNDIAISQLEIIPLPKGFFDNWLRKKGKFGGQNKVPKLVNSRQYANEFLKLLKLY